MLGETVVVIQLKYIDKYKIPHTFNLKLYSLNRISLIKFRDVSRTV